ncbi:hypothetical protein BGZ54_001923, partial [Gamsiella multidivaricata]
LIREDFPSASTPLFQPDLHLRFQSRPAGTIITKLLSNVGRSEPRKGPRGFKDSISMIDLAAMRDHIQSLRQANFDPRNYTKRSYVHRGSIRTGGFRLQLLAFKMKELQSVRYRRLPENVLPPRITSTTGGVDHYLTEVRNVVKTQQDVTDL